MSPTPLTRRSFLQIGAAALLALPLADRLRLQAAAEDPSAPREKSLILIWLAGGPATIDMWDLKPEAADEIRGEFRLIDTAVPGLQIGECLPQLAQRMDRCLLVRSLHHGIPAHGPGTQLMLTGNLPSPALARPSLGALAARLLPSRSGLPSYIAFDRHDGDGAGHLGAAYNPFEITPTADPQQQAGAFSLPPGFTMSQLETREALRQRFDRRLQATDTGDQTLRDLARNQQEAYDILHSDRIRRALDVTQLPQSQRDRYGNTPFGRNLLAARRLTEAGARFVTVGLGGWDTHDANFTTLRNQLLPQLDRALAALIEDLDDHARLDQTIVYCAGEFARTPRINGAAGRDHWARAMSVLLAGGPFRRGHAHGRTDRDGAAPLEDPCTPADLSATLLHALGIPPNQRLTTPTGRTLPLLDAAQTLPALYT